MFSSRGNTFTFKVKGSELIQKTLENLSKHSAKAYVSTETSGIFAATSNRLFAKWERRESQQHIAFEWVYDKEDKKKLLVNFNIYNYPESNLEHESIYLLDFEKEGRISIENISGKDFKEEAQILINTLTRCTKGINKKTESKQDLLSNLKLDPTLDILQRYSEEELLEANLRLGIASFGLRTESVPNFELLTSIPNLELRKEITAKIDNIQSAFSGLPNKLLEEEGGKKLRDEEWQKVNDICQDAVKKLRELNKICLEASQNKDKKIDLISVVERHESEIMELISQATKIVPKGYLEKIKIELDNFVNNFLENRLHWDLRVETSRYTKVKNHLQSVGYFSKSHKADEAKASSNNEHLTNPKNKL